MVDHDELRESLKWTPISQFRGCKELQSNSPYTTCLVHVLVDANNSGESLLSRAMTEVDKFNASPNNLKIGVMRAFPSMDGVSKVFHMYTDSTEEMGKHLAPNNATTTTTTRTTTAS